MIQRIFISSVQREFAKERKALAEMIRKDMLLGTFFEVFLFEETTAQNRSAQSVYLDEVRNSDIYLGLFGTEYGFEDVKGVSPTEREYDLATECDKCRLAFVKRASAHLRVPKERALIAKVERDVTRKSFSSMATLKKTVYESLFRYLQERDVVKDDKLIELTIPEKPRSRLQRYRVTRKGRQVAKLLAQSNRAAATLKEE